MNRTEPNTRQHGDGGFGDHRHINDNPVALLDTQLLQYRRAAVHFAVEFPVGVDLGFVDFGGDVNQRRLIGTVLQMPVNGVVTKIGFTADKPFDEGWLGVIQNFLGRFVPIDSLSFLAPKTFGVVNGTAMKFFVAGHA